MSKDAELAENVKSLTETMLEHTVIVSSLATQVKIMWGIMCAMGVGCITIGIFLIEKVLDVLFK